jgi:hypothetical protein
VVAYRNAAGNCEVSAFVGLRELQWPAGVVTGMATPGIYQLLSMAGFSYPSPDESPVVGFFASGFDSEMFEPGVTQCPLYVATRTAVASIDHPGNWTWEKIGTPPAPHDRDLVYEISAALPFVDSLGTPCLCAIVTMGQFVEGGYPDNQFTAVYACVRRGSSGDWQWLQLPYARESAEVTSIKVAASTVSSGLTEAGSSVWVFTYQKDDQVRLWTWDGEASGTFQAGPAIGTPIAGYAGAIRSIKFRQAASVGRHLGVSEHLVLMGLDPQSRLMLTEIVIGPGVQASEPRPADDGTFWDKQLAQLPTASLNSLSVTGWVRPSGRRLFSVATDHSTGNCYWNETPVSGFDEGDDVEIRRPTPWYLFLKTEVGDGPTGRRKARIRHL